MRTFVVLLCIALLTSLGSAASAQAMTRAEVLAECPDFDRAIACPGVAEEFLLSLPSGRRSNQQIFDVGVAISDAIDPETIPLEVCLDAQEGIHVLAEGLVSDGRRAELLALASDMCGDQMVTGSVGSLIGGGNGGGGGGGGPIVNPPGGGGGDCVSPGNSRCNGNSENSNYNPTALKD